MNKHDANYLKLKENKLLSIISKEKKVIVVAEEMNVTRNTVHKWLVRYKRYGIDGLIEKRKGKSGVPHNKTPEETEDIVVDLAKKYWQDGVDTLHDWLLFENQIDLHPSTIFRILKRKKVRYTDDYTNTQRSWKKKLYAHEVEGQEIQMDTTYPYGYGQSKVIYTAIDDATRIVYAYTYDKAKADNTVDFLQKLIEHTPFTIFKIRTDQGKEFLNLKVKDYLKAHNIQYRANTPYSPEENGKIERFHRTLNDKALRFGFYPTDSLDKFNYRLTLFLHYYNHVKKHRGLGMNAMSPQEKLEYLRSSRQFKSKV
jgi:transposase InsO family protein